MGMMTGSLPLMVWQCAQAIGVSISIGEVASVRVAFQKGDLAQCFTEDVAWRILVAQDRKLVRNERMIDHDQAVGVLLTYVLPLFHLVLQSTNVEAIPKTKLILVLGRRAPPLLL